MGNLRPTLLAALALASASLLVPAGAFGAAAEERVPPGNSAAEQYTETLPGAGGNRATRDLPDDRDPKQVLGRQEAERLEALGPDGQAAAELAARTAPGAQGGNARGGGAVEQGGESGLTQVLGEISGSSDSGGMGILLPLLLAMAAISALAFAIGRRRTGTERD